jgi:hypothetical protein
VRVKPEAAGPADRQIQPQGAGDCGVPPVGGHDEARAQDLSCVTAGSPQANPADMAALDRRPRHPRVLGYPDTARPRVMQKGTVEQGTPDAERSPVSIPVRVREQEAPSAHADAHAPKPFVLAGEDRVERSEPRQRIDDARAIVLAARLLAGEAALLEQQNIAPAARQQRGGGRPGGSAADYQHLSVEDVQGDTAADIVTR